MIIVYEVDRAAIYSRLVGCYRFVLQKVMDYNPMINIYAKTPFVMGVLTLLLTRTSLLTDPFAIEIVHAINLHALYSYCWSVTFRPVISRTLFS